MKIKLIIAIIFFIIILVFSYSNYNKNEINYTLLGNKEIFSNNILSKNFSDLIYDKLSKEKNIDYNKDYIQSDVRIIDLINEIKENKKINNKRTQYVLKNTDLLIIHIGNDEIYYKLSKLDSNENNDRVIYEYLDEINNDLIKLLIEIRKYNDKNIILLGYYNDTNNISNNKYYKYINKKIENYSNNNNIYFINTFKILNKKDNLTKTDIIYITNEGNLALFNEIYSKIDKLYLHKIY